jgi:tetratricopeptide (TPR) repeat protein
MPVRHLLPYIICTALLAGPGKGVCAQLNPSSEKVKKASKKIELGYKKDNTDTLAQGYFDMGQSFYQQGEPVKSETYFKKAKDLYEKSGDADGIAKSSRALAKVQEDQDKNKEALQNYITASNTFRKTGDRNVNALNGNDIRRLRLADTQQAQQLLRQNMQLGLLNKDTGETVSNLSRMADFNLRNKQAPAAISSFNTAYELSKNNPVQAQYYNQRVADLYVAQKDFGNAIATKKELLKEGFVQGSSQIKAQEIASLANIYLLQKEDSTALALLRQSYALSVQNGHTIEAKRCVEKMDSIFRSTGQKDLSLQLYKDYLGQLPGIIAKDSSITDNKLIAETESRIKELENEKALKDSLIRRKNIFNYWLIGSVLVLAVFTAIVLYILRKLRIRNKKIALQSLRREMNPHFIFNSLNSINQFIANNNELEANQYLTKFSTLMRRVMENSKEDFVLLANELELLENYLELEKRRFPDKFDFTIEMDDALLADNHYYMPGMLVQPHIENAIWHGLRYMEHKGQVHLRFSKTPRGMQVVIEDNGIGIAQSQLHKTENQKKRSGRGISNTQERIAILNELYRQQITCTVTDKVAPNSGVKVTLAVPLLKSFKA